MTRKKIVVLDDEKGIAAQYEKTLTSTDIVSRNFEAMADARIGDILAELTGRQLSARKGQKWSASGLEVDKADVLIIDYDLTIFKEPNASFLSGEIMAYMARCFSSCKTIVGMNRYGRNFFDLSLSWNTDSYTDLNIGSEQLINPGLWGEKWEPFRPWRWPDLSKSPEAFAKKTNEAYENSTKPIAQTLGISNIISSLPNSALRFLGRNPAKTTFSEFVTNSGNGLRAKDMPEGVKGKRKSSMPQEAVSRIAAARISKWLERAILQGQDILVDAPHLVNRYPSLLRGDHSKLKSWNKTTKLADASRLGIDHERIKDYRFEQGHWISRPVWFWRGIMNCREIKEVAEPWKKETTRFVFCEDTSSFAPRKVCREFVANLESPYITRFVRIPDRSVTYDPLINLFLRKNEGADAEA